MGNWALIGIGLAVMAVAGLVVWLARRQDTAQEAAVKEKKDREQQDVNNKAISAQRDALGGYHPPDAVYDWLHQQWRDAADAADRVPANRADAPKPD